MSKHILLTGGSGLLGKNLTQLLLSRGYTVSHLSRKAGTDPQVKTFIWDIAKGLIDESCIDGVDTIVHLAGAGIADERWTPERKEELIASRTQSIALIYELLSKKSNGVKSVISASGIGYYSDRGDELLTEDSHPSDDFLGECCIQWEKAVDAGKELGLRIVKFRTGVVLTTSGGALVKLAMPIKFGVGSPLGSGKQWISWIHHQDVANLYLYGIENNNLSGVFNMVAPNAVTNEALTKAVAKQLHRPVWLPNIPAFILKLLLGQMSTLVLGSTRVSATKIQASGYQFKYTDIESALKELYK
ncbi:MAG: TIGR01777 family oxidoreductase [Mucilaginibacter sp.]